jgi:hypothetical protein
VFPSQPSICPGSREFAKVNARKSRLAEQLDPIWYIYSSKNILWLYFVQLTLSQRLYDRSLSKVPVVPGLFQ